MGGRPAADARTENADRSLPGHRRRPRSRRSAERQRPRTRTLARHDPRRRPPRFDTGSLRDERQRLRHGRAHRARSGVLEHAHDRRRRQPDAHPVVRVHRCRRLRAPRRPDPRPQLPSVRARGGGHRARLHRVAKPAAARDRRRRPALTGPRSRRHGRGTTGRADRQRPRGSERARAAHRPRIPVQPHGAVPVPCRAHPGADRDHRG